MNRLSANDGIAPPWLKEIRFRDFEVSWAGTIPSPSGSGFCFGSEDGRILFTDEEGERLQEPAVGSLSKEAINGVACSEGILAVTTRREMTFWAWPTMAEGAHCVAELPYGAHGITVTAGKYFVAPLGRLGVMSAKARTLPSAILSSISKEGLTYYRVSSLLDGSGKEWLVCAGRSGGVGVTEFWGEQEGKHDLKTITFDRLDVVDICAIPSREKPTAAAALGRDGTLILFQDVLRESTPASLKLETIQGTAYSLFVYSGSLFVLTSKGIYVLFSLAERFLTGETLGTCITHILKLPMEAVDAQRCGDRWLLIVMPNGVHRVDLNLLLRSTPENISYGEFRDLQPQLLAPDWRAAGIQQSRQLLEPFSPLPR
jgi:hypothetical protein